MLHTFTYAYMHTWTHTEKKTYRAKHQTNNNGYLWGDLKLSKA